MTRGQMLFYGGALLLVLTVILAIIFAVKRPKYVPDLQAQGEPEPDAVQPAAGYGTGGNVGTLTAADAEATELLWEDATELLREKPEP